MQVNLIFGFLGSGKTTLVRHILETRAGRQPMAVIVNEFGDVGIDGAILEGRDVNMIELTSGCLCCTLKGSLLNAVEELRDVAGVEHTVIEATGLADPEEMIETFSEPAIRSSIAVGPFVTVVDAPKFAILRKILGEFYVAQIAHAEVLLLNKTDLISAERLESVRRDIEELNPRATVLLSEQCAIDVGLILDAIGGGDGPAGDAPHGTGHHAHAAFGSFVMDAGRDVKRAEVERFFGALPANVLRAKGFMGIEGRPCLVQFSAGQLDITPADQDRVRQMVFIGNDLDEAGIEARFAFANGSRGHGATAGHTEGTSQ